MIAIAWRNSWSKRARTISRSILWCGGDLLRLTAHRCAPILTVDVDGEARLWDMHGYELLHTIHVDRGRRHGNIAW